MERAPVGQILTPVNGICGKGRFIGVEYTPNVICLQWIRNFCDPYVRTLGYQMWHGAHILEKNFTWVDFPTEGGWAQGA